eukprot:1146063-Pelagomonas_calceolata.AAC.19
MSADNVTQKVLLVTVRREVPNEVIIEDVLLASPCSCLLRTQCKEWMTACRRLEQKEVPAAQGS